MLGVDSRLRRDDSHTFSKPSATPEPQFPYRCHRRSPACADSMALALLLADEWAKERGGKAVALTVDHGLREEEPAAARRHRCITGVLNAPCEHHAADMEKISLSYHSPSPFAKGLRRDKLTTHHSKTKPARRVTRLLTDWCKKHHVPASAHRPSPGRPGGNVAFSGLARGSGLDGLACMKAGFRTARHSVAPPPARHGKIAIRSYMLTRTQGQAWIEDPTNAKPALKHTQPDSRRYCTHCRTKSGIDISGAAPPNLAGLLQDASGARWDRSFSDRHTQITPSCLHAGC